MNRFDKLIALVLYLTGAFVLCAIPAIFLPSEWMASIHQRLGLGAMPEGPIVDYLARSLSALYGCLGVFTVCFATDVRKFAMPVAAWCILHIAVGSILVVVDSMNNMPMYWILAEGPPVVATGILVLWLQSASRHYDKKHG